MFDIDIDLEEIEKINNSTIKNIVYQLKMNGFAITNDNNISNQLSRKIPKLRKQAEKPILIMGPDRRFKKSIIAINPVLINPDKELEKAIKKIIRSFGNKF